MRLISPAASNCLVNDISFARISVFFIGLLPRQFDGPCAELRQFAQICIGIAARSEPNCRRIRTRVAHVPAGLKSHACVPSRRDKCATDGCQSAGPAWRPRRRVVEVALVQGFLRDYYAAEELRKVPSAGDKREKM